MNKWLKLTSYLTLFSIAMFFERARLTRFSILLCLCVLYCILTFLKRDRRPELMLVDIGIVVAMNLYSKFVVNPIFILMFAYVIMDIMILLKRPFHVMYGIFATMALTYVLTRRLTYEWHYQAVTEVFFTLLMFISFAVMLYYVRSYREARDDLEVANEKLNAHYTALRNSEQTLREVQNEVGRLARVEERMLLAKKLHDTVGHELTGLIMLLEVNKMQAETSHAKQAFGDLAKQTREILSTLRKSVSETVDESNLFLRLSDAIDRFKKQTQKNVHCFFEIPFEKLSEPVALCAYRTFLESLTNAAKHSNATDIWLSLQTLNTSELILKVLDNGTMEGTFKLGHGLKFMQERVWALGGEIEFTKDETGFSTIVKLPFRATDRSIK